MNNFNKLGLSKSTLEVLDSLGFETPMPVQEKAIPILLSKEAPDFIGLAQTGTGKTAAFGLPLVERIDTNNKATQALIMAPTRELGQQIAQQLSLFSSNNRALNVLAVYGGAAISNQIRALKKPTHIVVATPGRLLDLIKRKAVRLDSVKYVVLDEADEMLNMGFKEDIDKILAHTPDDRVTWLFSATMPPEIRKIVEKYMDAPREVAINAEEKINKDIEHKYVLTKTSNKIPALRRFLDMQPDMRGIMFCRTRRETKKIANDLGDLGYNVEALHGDLSQGQRDAVMSRFKTRSMQLLIATDVAARGIDVDDLSHVLHHSLPDVPESYTHRSGRTARVGKKGISLAFVSGRETGKLHNLEKKIHIKFEQIPIPGSEELKSRRINNWASLIINTKVDEQAESILNDLHDQFAHLSKEDILKRLITSQLDHMMVSNNEEAYLNEKPESTGEEPEKRRANGRKTKRTAESNRGGETTSGSNRYFVNIGSIDGVTKGDLIHFLSDVSGVKRKHFGELSLQKNCAYFNVANTQDAKLSGKFTGIEIEGRPIRVNADDQDGSNRGPKRGRTTPGANRETLYAESSGRRRPKGSSFSRQGSSKRKNARGDFKKKRRH